MSMKSIHQMRAFASLYGASAPGSDFAPYKTGENFKIWHHDTDFAVEYVELWGASKPHLHTKGSSAFWFLTPAELQLGGASINGPRMRVNAFVSRFQAEPGIPYLVPAYVFHAVSPLAEPARFFVFNDAPRLRSASEYTDDSHFADHVTFLPR